MPISFAKCDWAKFWNSVFSITEVGCTSNLDMFVKAKTTETSFVVRKSCQDVLSGIVTKAYRENRSGLRFLKLTRYDYVV